MKLCYSVIGLGMGDEGKGVVTNILSSKLEEPLVIRYSGGQQAGHTVYKNEKESHVFSNFGSGTFNNVPTYWSPFCTVDPIAVIHELDCLLKMGVNPKLYIDKFCPLTTPYDVIHNREQADKTGHGSVGAGVGSTYKREMDGIVLSYGDLKYPNVVYQKLNLIREFYNLPIIDLADVFLECGEKIHKIFGEHTYEDMLRSNFKSFIFEGSQGLMLDQYIGFFPHVTRSNTGLTNINEMMFTGVTPSTMELVTRGYQTRHGNGPMLGEKIQHNIPPNPYETNKYHTYQGKFRTALLNTEVINYAIDKDNINTKKSSLTITCMDLVKYDLRYIGNEGDIVECKNIENFCVRVANDLNISTVYYTEKPYGDRVLIK